MLKRIQWMHAWRKELRKKKVLSKWKEKKIGGFNGSQARHFPQERVETKLTVNGLHLFVKRLVSSTAQSQYLPAQAQRAVAVTVLQGAALSAAARKHEHLDALCSAPGVIRGRYFCFRTFRHPQPPPTNQKKSLPLLISFPNDISSNS